MVQVTLMDLVLILHRGVYALHSGLAVLTAMPRPG